MRAPEWWSWYWGLDWTERHAWTALAVGVVAGIVVTAFSHEGRIVLGLFLAAILLVVVLLRISRKDAPSCYHTKPKTVTPEKRRYRRLGIRVSNINLR